MCFVSSFQVFERRLLCLDIVLQIRNLIMQEGDVDDGEVYSNTLKTIICPIFQGGVAGEKRPGLSGAQLH